MPELTGNRMRALPAAGLAALLAACAAQGELEPRHAPSGLPTPLPQADFAAYVEQAKAQIAAANQAIGKELALQVIDDRAPFELVPDRARCPRSEAGRHARAVLLIHGLGDSAYAMRDLAARFAAACYLARAILLPGHGTVPGDLLEVGYGEWIEATRQGVLSFADQAEKLYLVGFAAGGTLALDYALGEHRASDPALGGLVLLAPALAPRSGFGHFVRSYIAAGALMPAGGFAELLPEEDPVRYASVARNAEDQLNALIDRLEERERPLELPVFMALSATDAVIDPEAARRWFCRRLIGPRDLIWYAPGGTPFDDCRFAVVRASDPWPGILDLAHPALPIAPDDPHYGVTGDHVECSHYYWETDTPNWLLCLDPGKTPANSAIRYGEISRRNLAAHVIRRLTYNPDFDALMGEILAFIDRLPAARPPLPRSKPAR
ncbi:MAG TPA: alpha/beta fold hydrolase [Geminicoccaceae bacterium]|nr:alpha/beta fold hydrolase [Geminicoccaceae bacterium]